MISGELNVDDDDELEDHIVYTVYGHKLSFCHTGSNRVQRNIG